VRIDFSHHAYCLEGDSAFVKEKLFEILEKDLKFKTRGNPDLWVGKFDMFGINDGRALSSFQNKKAVAGERKVIIIGTNRMTREAQNSLLKTFEEPAPNTHFFLIMPSSETLLPTLRSRMVIEKLERKESSELGRKFLKASRKERLDLVKQMAENKDRSGAIELLNQLEKIFYEKVERSKASSEIILLMETINKFRGYLNDRAPNLKMILEHIALITPR